jgi:hypothetical protein
VSVKETSDTVFKTGQQRSVETITGAGAFHSADDNASLLERFQMLADGGLGQGQTGDQFAAKALFFRFQELNDLHADGMSHGFANPGQFIPIKA